MKALPPAKGFPAIQYLDIVGMKGPIFDRPPPDSADFAGSFSGPEKRGFWAETLDFIGFLHGGQPVGRPPSLPGITSIRAFAGGSASELQSKGRSMFLTGVVRGVRRAAHIMLTFGGLSAWLAVTPNAPAASVTLAWDPSPDTNVVGYYIYFGPASGDYTNKLSAGPALTLTVPGLAPGGRYYFSATAVDATGLESEFSEEVSTNLPPVATNLPPVANPAIVQVAEDQTVAITLTGSDPNNDPLSFQIVANPANGTLIGTPPNLTYRPTPNYFGSDSFTFRVRDGFADSAPATVSITVTPVNDPPTLNALAARSVNENAAAQNVTLSGIGAGATNEADVLTVTAVSSNPGVVPHPTVAYTSPAATGILTFRPATNAYGSAVITVTVNDGQAQNSTLSRSFTVTVNAAPRISPIASQPAIAGVATGPIPFTVSDPDDAAAGLTLTAASSLPAVVPVSNIVFGGSGSNRTVTITPLADKVGNATISVAVSDGKTSMSTSFILAVTAPKPGTNTAPYLSEIAAQVGTQDKTTGPIPLTVGDAETAATSLTLSATSSNPGLLALTNIVFGGSGSNRTVTLIPNTGQTGLTYVTITVSDSQAVASRTFSFDVLPPGVAVALKKVGDGKVGGALAGTTYTAMAAAEPGSAFVGWTGSITSSAPTLTLTLRKKILLQANFAPFEFRVNGNGRVSPDIGAARSLVFGRRYTLTAIPNDGYEFAGWTGSVTSASSTISLVLQTNTVLGATFVPSPFVPVAGLYDGLFHEEDQVTHQSSGFFRLLLTKRGYYTSRVLINGKAYHFTGRFALDCRATNVISRLGAPPLTLRLLLGTGPTADQITGEVTDGVWKAALASDRAMYRTATGGSPIAGRYTVVVPGSETAGPVTMGDGYAGALVNTQGLALVSGKLADGAAFLASAYVSKKGQWPLYLPLYAGKGSVLGWLTFANRPDDDLNGLVSWIKPPIAGAQYYPGGFSLESLVIGSAYLKPMGATNHIVKLDDAHLAFVGGNLTANFTNSITLGNFSQVSNNSTNGLLLTFNLANGRFSGQVRNPLTRDVRSFGGVVLQKRDEGYGSLFGTNQTSRVILAE